MKTKPPRRRRITRWSLMIFSVPFFLPPLTAEDPSNPRAEKLRDRAEDKASREAEKVRDRSRRANRDAREVKDEDRRANRKAEEKDEAAGKANERARESGDDTPDRANEEAAKVADETGDKASERAREVRDDASRRAIEEADKVEDADGKANPDARRMRDRAEEKANPDASEGAEPSAEQRARQAQRDERMEQARDDDDDAATGRGPAGVNEEAAARDGRKGDAPGDHRGRPARESRPTDAGDRDMDDSPEPEPEVVAEAEKEVQETIKEVEAELQQRKLKIEGKAEANSIIQEVLGEQSRLSRAEVLREERSRARAAARQREDAGIVRQRRAAADFLRQRLRGEATAAEVPEFFRRPHFGRDGRDRGRRDHGWAHEPRYFHEGRRYVHFDSRAAIPAILLATAALERVRIQPAGEVDRVFFEERRQVDAPLPPAEYRGQDAWVVSYPVNKESMISSNDILFLQGSTQFADAHSYDMVLVLAEAMNDSELARSRFVVEGHASAEGGYDDNMELSQRRAEAIVRDLVRNGIEPDRLIPVGYGESEARYPANAAENLRALDRRVMVFKLEDQPVAGR